MSIPQLRPEARTTLLLFIEEALFSKTRKRFAAQMKELVRQNSVQHGNTQRGLHYRGRVYLAGPGKLNQEGPMNTLHASLRPQMKEHIESLAAFEQEKDVVMGYVLLVIRQSRYSSDLEKLFPQALQRILNKLDRFFLPGDGTLSDEVVQQFRDDNHKYSRLVQARLAYNLLDIAAV